ncbi:MAG: hypothetical protein GF329_16165 [Candidatus Lokiarchaeota archaeon]|nr:hypothetical protein [Candidatus Lokiarchaeota archaeon]
MTTDLEELDGVGPNMAEKLIENGFRTLDAIAAAKPGNLTRIHGISQNVAEQLIEQASKKAGGAYGLKFITGDELVKFYESREKLTTGCKSLDKILKGGLVTGKLYEFWGPEGSGKSNMALQLVCTAAMPKEKGGLGGKAIYIDAENSLSMERVGEIAPRFGLDPLVVFKGISRNVPQNVDALLYVCEKLLPKIIQETGAKIIVLDSIATHFRSEYGAKRQELPERQQKASKVAHALKRCAKIYECVALMTNQSTADPSGWGSGIKHSMGNIIGHESEVRIRITVKSTKNKERNFYIEKAVDLPNETVILKISKTGFHDKNGSVKVTAEPKIVKKKR